MSKKLKLQKILGGLSNVDSGLGDAFKSVEKEMARVAEKIRSESDAQTVKQVRVKFEEVKEAMQGLSISFKSLKEELAESERGLLEDLNSKFGLLQNSLAELKTTNGSRSVELSKNIDTLREEVKILSEKKIKIPDFGKKIIEVENNLAEMVLELKEGNEKAESLQSTDFQKKITAEAERLEEEIQKLRRDAMSALSRNGNGNANLQINVNSSVASTKYADINFQQFGNIGWSAVNDDTNKRVNIRASILAGGSGSGTPGGNNTEVQYNAGGSFAGDPALAWASSVLAVGQPGSVAGRIDLAGATSQTVRVQVPSTAGAWTLTLPPNDGASGQYLLTDGNGITQWASVTGGSGITRTVSVLSVSSTLAAATSTDYTFFVNDGIRLTLPNAISNTNRYSIKNVSTSSVQVAATTGQDIDGATTALLTKQYEAIDLMSNSSVWGIY